jgi:cytochrome P450
VPEGCVAAHVDVSDTGDLDPAAGHDDRHSRCPVAHDTAGWTVDRHEDVRAAALDDVTFSNATSRFLKVPNGLDGDEHTAFRSLVDRYLTADRLTHLRPAVARVADQVVDDAIRAAGSTPARVDAVALGGALRRAGVLRLARLAGRSRSRAARLDRCQPRGDQVR